MSRGLTALAAAGLATLLCLSAGCDIAITPQEPPADAALSKAVGELYLRSGLASDVSSSKILGKHYRPAQDTWKVVACVEFVMGESGSGRDCNDSFELYRLDSGSWMVNGTLNGAYRWVELPESELVGAATPGS
jgi:hypothetical protein